MGITRPDFVATGKEKVKRISSLFQMDYVIKYSYNVYPINRDYA